MEHKKIRVGILFGGKSAEHEVSVQSAKNVLAAIDKLKFDPVLIGIDKQGQWHLTNQESLLKAGEVRSIKAPGNELTLLPGSTNRQLINVADQIMGTLDVVFPILHGPMGEDGTVQGFLELANVPYVGSGVLGSAIGMDKDVMKRLLRDAGIPITKFIVLSDSREGVSNADRLIEDLGLPLFIKPANMGSSVGVSKAKDKQELIEAITKAFEYDRKILVEAAVDGDEIECSILGNRNPKASLPGRIIPQDDYYSYEAKYIDENGAVLEIPAKLSAAVVKKVQDVAIRAFRVLECEGMARVDMFVTSDGKVVLNEVNTIPGFTKISMYPQLWEASGLTYKELISQLITLAIERHNQKQKLKTNYSDGPE